ncbi:hypothetical protein GF407_11195 [candidate division KSB1 bacterium]|nr:hypothetical protein [candidate division KSB1 bacterium]
MAAVIPDLVDAGANVIGGSCATTPDHIRAVKKAVHSINQVKSRINQFTLFISCLFRETVNN